MEAEEAVQAPGSLRPSLKWELPRAPMGELSPAQIMSPSSQSKSQGLGLQNETDPAVPLNRGVTRSGQVQTTTK